MIVDLASYETRMLAMHVALERLDRIRDEKAQRMAAYINAWDKKLDWHVEFDLEEMT